MRMGDHPRQGDVILRRVRAVPKGARRIEPQGGRIVVAWGETTGHAHALAAGKVEAYESDGVLYLVVGEEAELVHEEHAPITYPPGVYEQLTQVEHTPWGARQVAD